VHASSRWLAEHMQKEEEEEEEDKNKDGAHNSCMQTRPHTSVEAPAIMTPQERQKSTIPCARVHLQALAGRLTTGATLKREGERRER